MLEAFLIVLRPILDAWDQEFGGRAEPAAPAPLPCEPVEPPADPTPEVPVSEPVVVMASPAPMGPLEHCFVEGPEPAFNPATDCPVCEWPLDYGSHRKCAEMRCEPVPALDSPAQVKSVQEPAPAVKQAEPLYVRRGAGRGARYDVAGPDQAGERYRRRVGAGGRPKYEPVRAER